MWLYVTSTVSLCVSFSGESQSVSSTANDLSVLVHHHDSVASDLATIVETLTLDTQPPPFGKYNINIQQFPCI